MRGTVYNADFYREEISRITLWLTQPISAEERSQLQRELESAKSHLAGFKKGE